MNLLVIALVVIVGLIIAGIGWDGFLEALEKGWNNVPADDIIDNFKEATVESINDVQQEMEERVEEPTIDDLTVEEDIFKGALDGLKINFKGDG